MFGNLIISMLNVISMRDKNLKFLMQFLLF